MSGKATVNVDDGLEDIRWIRPWYGEREVARGVLRSSPKPEKRKQNIYLGGIPPTIARSWEGEEGPDM